MFCVFYFYVEDCAPIALVIHVIDSLELSYSMIYRLCALCVEDVKEAERAIKYKGSSCCSCAVMRVTFARYNSQVVVFFRGPSESVNK